jgi:hypothetical protein|tara:strand:- start:233 stop:409 length:177 start_codon:yes stop_codon:yes gene_type:complete
MNPVPPAPDLETQKLVDEYLKKGGEITECPAFQVSEHIEYTGGFYQRRKKKNEEGKAK